MAYYNTVLTLDTYIGTETQSGSNISWSSNSNIVSTPSSYAKVEKLGASVYDTGGDGNQITYISEWITAKKSDMSSIPSKLRISQMRFIIDYDITFKNFSLTQTYYGGDISTSLGVSKNATKPGGSGNTGTVLIGESQTGIVIYDTYNFTRTDQTSSWLAASNTNIVTGDDLKDSNFRVFSKGLLYIYNQGTNFPDLTLKVSKLRLEIEGNLPSGLLQVTTFQ